jgi:Fe-S-cluster containining protein
MPRRIPKGVRDHLADLVAWARYAQDHGPSRQAPDPWGEVRNTAGYVIGLARHLPDRLHAYDVIRAVHMILAAAPPYTRARCTDCGRCCAPGGSFHMRIMVLTPEDVDRLEAVAPGCTESYGGNRLKPAIRQRVESGGETGISPLDLDPLDRGCTLLDPETRLCTVYPHRPSICRDFVPGCRYCILLGPA